MFQKILIANRGEIAVRLSKTIQEMGIKAVSIYSSFDEFSQHVAASNEAYHLSGQTLQETYLNIEEIIEIAKLAGADAIHPGYGFLSENVAFAQACKDAGIVFIGPEPKVISGMGDKIVAKKIMQQAGVPVIPGWAGDINDLNEIKNVAEKIGYPILVKAAAGGGGKGMRLVKDVSSLQEALESAGREAQRAFSDGRVFIEKYIEDPRHIEFQIFGDSKGNIVHLFERECSIQRRHQKIIEESPSVALSPELRIKMGEAAIKAAKAIGYTNAGTVEFILDKNKNFYFLEVNTRLQVEHPVTELVMHGDLVRAQLLIAAGESLQILQKDLKQDGHSIECRIYAEDPENNFLPSIGKLHVYKEPQGPSIRVDSGVKEGDEVSIHYDPMLSKLIVWAKTRNAAIEKMLWALSNYIIIGVKTNVSFLHKVISTKAFKDGNIDTHFLEKHLVQEDLPSKESELQALAISALIFNDQKNISSKETSDSFSESQDPWLCAGEWRLV